MVKLKQTLVPGSSQLKSIDKGFLSRCRDKNTGGGQTQIIFQHDNSSHISQVICVKSDRIIVDTYHNLQLKISSAPLFLFVTVCSISWSPNATSYRKCSFNKVLAVQDKT